MDLPRLLEAIKATLDADKRQLAEDYLTSVHKIIGFAPSLLQMVMSEQLEGPVRQAAVVYLKNTIQAYWNEKSEEAQPGEAPSMIFAIHEQDRHILRENIIQALIQSPEVIRVQLAVCIGTILKQDFPMRWNNVIDKLIVYMNAKDGQSLMGALVVLYQLVKNFEYKKPKDRIPLVEAMKIVLPILYERMVNLMADASQESAYLQKMVLKIFYSLVQYLLNLEMMSVQAFGHWMELVRQIVERPVPAETLNVDEEDRSELVWWKCKKWAMRLMTRIFERYGTPGQVSSEYNTFADYYLKNFAAPAIATVFHVLETYRKKEYVAPIVLHQALAYLQTAVSHAFAWKFIKQHMFDVIQHVIFPLCCHNEKDEELWREDPQEFIRTKYDVYDELINPTSAAIALLTNAMKRKNLLAKVVQFIVQILNDPNSTPQQLDGALHMIGALAPNLMKKKIYKNELENMLHVHVFPRFLVDHKFLRARAAWCVSTFSEVAFKDEANLRRAVELCINGLLNDPELPVKFECATAIQMLLTDQMRAKELIEIHIKPIVLAMLKLIRETENDDLTTVLSKLIMEYTEQVTPIAVEIAQELANIFTVLIQSDDSVEDRAITAMGVLSTLESILDAVEENKEIMEKLEAIVTSVIHVIFQNNVMDFYEEALNLVYSATCTQVSPTLWEVYQWIYKLFTDDGGVDYFMDMMPPLHNYITVDSEAFIAVPTRFEIIFNMCKHIFDPDVDAGDNAESHAAKLLEVLILQFNGRIDGWIRPITELVLSRLAREAKTSELRTMCLQVLIAGLHYNPSLMLETLGSFQPPGSQQSIIDQFVKQWLFDTDCFLGLHDRKMCIIGLTTLMGMTNRPQVMAEVVGQVLPSCIVLFDGLQKAYESKALRDGKDDDDEDSGEDVEEGDEALDSDEDEVNDDTQEYLERLARSEQDSGNDDDYSDSDCIEETDLENYDTLLDGDDTEVDEYIMFKATLHHLEQTEPLWYEMLTKTLTDEQRDAIKNVFTLADQKKAAIESRKIEKEGGYQFNVQQVPASFNFGGFAFN